MGKGKKTGWGGKGLEKNSMPITTGTVQMGCLRKIHKIIYFILPGNEREGGKKILGLGPLRQLPGEGCTRAGNFFAAPFA
jgi:hypothetical protein